MTDTDKLKRLAEELIADDDCPMLVPPQTILAMIAENERLEELYDLTGRQCDGWMSRAKSAEKQCNEAVALLREAHKAYGAWTGKTCKQEQADDANAAFLARIDGTNNTVA